MKIITAVGTALLGAALLSGSAFGAKLQSFTAASAEAPSMASVKATEYGKSLPPVGYVQFCARGEDECKFQGGKIHRIALSDEKFDQINQVNSYVNAKIKPTSDFDQYGVADYWTYPVNAGDCEDYVLLKKRYLEGLGFSADELLITVVFDENGEGHAVLTIVADAGDLVLDNRRNEVLMWNQTGYKFLKRQSQLDPKNWISLQKTTTQVQVSTKAQ